MSFGEIARIALIDTALGMGTVFVILIFISICIWLLGKACGAKPVRKPAAAAAAAEPEAAEPEGIRPEVVAAITAAIHHQMKEEEVGDDQYIVRNIRRATWRHTS